MKDKQNPMSTENKTEVATSEEITTSVVRSIMDGSISEETLGTALKSLQIQMAATLISSQGKAIALVDGVSIYADKLKAKFDEVFAGEIDRMTGADELMGWLERINNMQLKTLEVQRKIIQGKELFSTTVMSAEEKMLSRLLASFSSKEEKSKFMEIVKSHMDKNEENSFDE